MKTKQWRWSDVRRAVESVFIPGERKALLDAFQAAGERKQYKALAGLRQTEWRLAQLPVVTIEARLIVTRGALSEFTTLEVRANGEVGPPNGPWYDAIARQINRGLGIAPQENPTKRPRAAKAKKGKAAPTAAARKPRTHTYYHVTERRFVPDIVARGFVAGGGSGGAGTYLFQERRLADDWIDGQASYEDPVILIVKTSDPVAKVIADGWDEPDQLYGHFIFKHSAARWTPSSIELIPEDREE